MTININTNNPVYTQYSNILGAETKNNNTNEVSNMLTGVSNDIFNTVKTTLSSLGVDFENIGESGINPATLAENDSINNFMNTLFSAVNNSPINTQSSKTYSNTDASSQIQNLISQLNQDNAGNIMATQLKQDFSKISQNKDVSIQSFLTALSSNLAGENLQTTGNNLDIFAS